MSNIFNFKDNITEYELDEVANTIREGKLVVFPTETVYGIGTNALDGLSCKKIYEAKGRPSDNPLIVHVSDFDMLKKYVSEISDTEKKLIDTFMPGPFTLILKKKDVIPDTISAGLDTVGIRMPSNNIAHEIIKRAGVPIAAPSANVSGKPSGTNIDDIKKELLDKVSIMIDGGSSDIGLESTVVKVVDDVPVILRPGKVSKEDIESVVGKVIVDKNVLGKVKEDEKVESPGMKHKHYAPNTKCVLVYFDNEKKQINEVNKLLLENENACVIGYEEHMSKINAKRFINMGKIDNLNEISKNIFSSLRKADNMNCDLIIIEGTKKEGIGLAIMNRLIRACNYDVKEEI